MEYMTSTSPYPPNNINDPSSSTSVPLIPLQHQQWPLQISPVPTTGTGLEGKTKQKTNLTLTLNLQLALTLNPNRNPYKQLLAMALTLYLSLRRRFNLDPDPRLEQVAIRHSLMNYCLNRSGFGFLVIITQEKIPTIRLIS